MKLYDLIKKLLIENPELRDSDKKLMWKVWQIEGIVSDGSIAYDSFIERKTTSPESIRRCRQKIQETTPSLGATKSRTREVRKEIERQRGTFIYRDIVSGKITNF